MISKFSFKLTAILALLTAGLTFSQTHSDALRLSDIGLGSNARALGMGNAYIGLSDDFSAASYNPAGFGLLKRMEFSGGLNYNKFNNNTTLFGNPTDYSNSSTKLDQLSFAFPFPTLRGSLVFAVGYSKEKDFNRVVDFKGFNGRNNSMVEDMTFSSLGDLMYDIGLSYPVYDQNDKYLYEDTYLLGNLEQSGSYLHSGSLGKWSFSSAIEVARNVFIGGTLNIYSGEFKSTEEFYEKDTRNIYGMNVWTDTTDPSTADFRQFSMKENLLWDISGWDAKIGFLYQIRKFARFGATIKFPTSFSIKEDYSVSVESEFGTGASYKSDTGEPYHMEYGITTPFIISGGASFNLMGLILSGDISFVDFTQMEFDEGKDILMEDVSDINRDIKDLYRSVVNLNAGLEYTIPNAGIRLRGGFIYNPSPYQGDPSERNRKYVTGGIGFLADETFAFDMAYAYGWWKDIGENYQPNGSSTTFQDITVSNLIFTFSYRF